MTMKKTLSDMKRVWKVTKKPTKKEYLTTLKVVFFGLLIVGLIGFLMEIIWQVVLRRLFV